MATDEVDPLEAVRQRLSRDQLHVVQSVSTNGTAPSSNGTTATTGKVIGRTRLTSELASGVSLIPPVFIWEGWLERGAYQLLAGVQGTGKTTWVSHIVALLTRGEPLPGDPVVRAPMNVAFLSLEESKSRVVSRLKAAGADLDRVHIIGLVEDWSSDGGAFERPWRMPGDIGILEALIVEHNIDVAIVDGLGYSIESGGEPGYSVVGQVLSALGKAAERSDSAILGLTHVPKGGGDGSTAAIGSTAWTALARVFWLVNQDPETKLCLVGIGKTNHAHPEPDAYSFEIADDPEGSKAGIVVNIQGSQATANEITHAHKDDPDKGARADAKEFLRGELIGQGERLVKELLNEADVDYGINKTTLYRAKADLGIKGRKLGQKEGWVWWWADDCPDENVSPLPERDGRQGYLEDCHAPPLEGVRGSSGDVGNLRPDQGFSAPEGQGQLEGSHLSRSDNLPNPAPSNIIVRDDVDRSEIFGLPKMAMARYRAGLPLNNSDEQALIDAGFATRRAAE